MYFLIISYFNIFSFLANFFRHFKNCRTFKGKKKSGIYCIDTKRFTCCKLYRLQHRPKMKCNQAILLIFYCGKLHICNFIFFFFVLKQQVVKTHVCFINVNYYSNSKKWIHKNLFCIFLIMHRRIHRLSWISYFNIRIFATAITFCVEITFY